MKNVKEYFVEVFTAELPKFVNVMNALPADKLTWKPDEKSSTAIELASAIAGEQMGMLQILESCSFEYDPVKMAAMTFPSTAEATKFLQDTREKIKARAAA